jgi:hypothetical protein
MGIGVGIVLIAIGAVLTFAVHVTFSGFSIQTVGIILMIVGAVGLLIDLAIFMPRRRSVVATRTDAVDPYAAPAASRTVYQERQTL